MDSLFLLSDGDRAAFLRQMMQSFGCLHICLWSYLPHPSNCLLAMDGLLGETRSSGNIANRLFDLYRESVNYVDIGRIPGFAFKNNLRYMELKLHDLQRMASHEVQLQFYQEAGIKTVVFMGCAAGEIELGMSNDHPRVDLEKEMKNLFPIDFNVSGELPNHPPSSSSSLSLSADSSSDYSQLLFNTPTPTPSFVNHQPDDDALLVTTPPLMTTTALVAALISPSTTSTNFISITPTAFRRYSPRRAANNEALGPAGCKQNMFKRSVLFFRNLSMRRRQDELVQAQGSSRPTDTQMHHMISERKRREKLNDSFQVLRSLLPTGTKKDKVSVLSSTTEYLSSLRTQVDELSKRNQMLESQLSVHGLLSFAKDDDPTVDSVEMKHVSSSDSEAARFLDLRVRVKSLGEHNNNNNNNNNNNSMLLDLVTRMLGFLKQQTSVSLSSLQSNTTSMLESSFPVHEMTMRLKIEGDEFDEPGFGEAVRRVIDDQRH